MSTARPPEDDPSPTPDRAGTFDTTGATIWLERGIVFVTHKSVVNTIDSVKEGLAVIGLLVGDRPRPLLWDARLWRGYGPNVWRILISAIDSLATSVAMVVSPDEAVSVGPFPELINRLLIPYRVFTDRDEALGYLQGWLDRAGSTGQ